MPARLSLEKVDYIKQLIKEGYTQKSVARLVNCCVGTVSRIISPKAIKYSHNSHTTKKRCPGCGRMIKMACLACKIKND